MVAVDLLVAMIIWSSIIFVSILVAVIILVRDENAKTREAEKALQDAFEEEQ